MGTSKSSAGRTWRATLVALTGVALVGGAMMTPASAATPSEGASPDGTVAASPTANPLPSPMPTDQQGVKALQEDVQASMDDAQAALEGTNAQLAQTYRELQDAQAKLPAAQAELDQAEQTLAAAEREVQNLTDRLATAQGQEAQLQIDMAEGQRQIDSAKATLAQAARAAYSGQSTTGSSLALMLGVTSLSDLNSQLAARSAIDRTQTGTLASLNDIEATNRNRQARLSAIRTQIADLKVQAELKQNEADAARTLAAVKRNEIAGLIAANTEIAARLETQKEQYRAEFDALTQADEILTSELKRLAEEERQRQAEEVARQQAEKEAAKSRAGSGDGSAPSSTGRLGMPIADPRVTSEYGQRFHPIYQVWRLHAGMDFGAGCGTPIYAAESGVVLKAAYSGNSAGNMIVISHGIVDANSIMTGYLHLSAFNVTAGQAVNKGDVIGYVGTTGASTGCHLHFEVYQNGSTVNPRPWLF